MQKSSKLKSTARKPLIDISNNRKSTTVSKKKIPSDDVDGGVLDRLLLVRSELSNLFGQIDELVAGALGSNVKDKNANHDIESFGNVLLDMQSNLKPWVLRLRHTLSAASTVEENRHNQILPAQPTRANILKNQEINFNESEGELDLKVSPSPLVSWRTGSFADSYTIEAGKQLFLLTPLPKSKVSQFKCPASTRTMVKILHENTSKPKIKENPHFIETEKTSENIIETEKISENVIETKKISENILEVQTPCNDKDRSEEFCSDDAVLKVLTSKYQDLLGTQENDTNSCKNGGKDMDLDWFLSPPKTCVVMEPSNDDKVVPTPAIMATPLSKDMENTIMKGRNAGENTLKRELWTKFEQVSKDGLHFDKSVFQKLPRKGFMDMLEEACESECGHGNKL